MSPKLYLRIIVTCWGASARSRKSDDLARTRRTLDPRRCEALGCELDSSRLHCGVSWTWTGSRNKIGTPGNLREPGALGGGRCLDKTVALWQTLDGGGVGLGFRGEDLVDRGKGGSG